MESINLINIVSSFIEFLIFWILLKYLIASLLVGWVFDEHFHFFAILVEIKRCWCPVEKEIWVSSIITSSILNFVSVDPSKSLFAVLFLFDVTLLSHFRSICFVNKITGVFVFNIGECHLLSMTWWSKLATKWIISFKIPLSFKNGWILVNRVRSINVLVF